MIELHNGDCLEILKQIPDGSVDMVLTDPPYGIDYQSSRVKDKNKRFSKILNDKKPFIAFIGELSRVLHRSGCCMIFTRWDVQQVFIDELTKHGLKPKNVIIWDKVVHGMGDLQRSFGSRYESIIFVANPDFRFTGKRPTDIIRQTRVPANKLLHPNEKPVDLLAELINKCTKNGSTVLDCFMGSGSTGVACVNTGRKFIGIELDEHYFNVAEQRIKAAKDELAQIHD